MQLYDSNLFLRIIIFLLFHIVSISFISSSRQRGNFFFLKEIVINLYNIEIYNYNYIVLCKKHLRVMYLLTGHIFLHVINAINARDILEFCK